MQDFASILEVESVTKSFGGVRAVNNCTLSVRRGTITGLIGPNGAGKTTLFNLITGFLTPDSGRILFRGERIDVPPPAPMPAWLRAMAILTPPLMPLRLLVRLLWSQLNHGPHQTFHKGIVRTFQIPRELKTMTVLENLMLVPPDQAGEQIWNPWLFGFRVSRQEREIYEKALEILEFVDLLHLRDEYAANLSGGQKKLLELARTLMCDPQMILLDEPGAGVNRVLMRRLVENIETLCRDRSITFFVIEHDMDLITRLCNPVIVMSQGEHLAEGSPEEIKQDERVLEAYLGGQYR